MELNLSKVKKKELYNLDMTLAKFILPRLKAYRKNPVGAPFIDNEDVPKKMRYKGELPDDGEVDEFFYARWDYVLGEMIHGFKGAIKNDSSDRTNNGLRLFGRYFRGLWQ